MKRITVRDKAEVKKLLYLGYVLGLKDDLYRSFGGFQRWWYDKEHDICRSCGCDWLDPHKKIESYSLDKAAKILWHKHNSLFAYTKSGPLYRTTPQHAGDTSSTKAIGDNENADSSNVASVNSGKI